MQLENPTDRGLAFLAEVNEAHARIMECGSQVVRVRITLADGRRQTYDYPAKGLAGGGQNDTPAPTRRRSAVQTAILDALAEAPAPLKAKTLAARAGIDYERSDFRSALAALQRENIIVRPDPDELRYWLRSRETPEE